MNPAGQPSAGWLALPSEGRARTFQAKPLWQRAIVVAAGPITNFLIAILILAGFALAYGERRTPATSGTVIEGSAAARIGSATGDSIVSLGGSSMATLDSIGRYVTI